MFAIVMKEKIIGRWNRLKDTYRRYRFRGFAGWCMIRVLAKLGIRLRIMYYYAKRLDSATDGRGMREYKELGLADFEAQVPVLPERFTGEKMSRIKDAFSVEGNHAYGIYDGEVLVVYGCNRKSGIHQNRQRGYIKNCNNRTSETVTTVHQKR